MKKIFSILILSMLVIFCPVESHAKVDSTSNLSNIKKYMLEDKTPEVLTEFARIPNNNANLNSWIMDNANNLNPLYLYMFSERMMLVNKNEAVYWYVIARLRSTYLASITTSGEVSQGANKYALIAPTVTSYFKKNYRRTDINQSAMRALEWDKSQYPYEVKSYLLNDKSIKFVSKSTQKRYYNRLQDSFRTTLTGID